MRAIARPKRLFAGERHVGGLYCASAHHENVVVTNAVDLGDVVFVEQRSDGPEGHELTRGIAHKLLDVDAFGHLAFATHRLGLLAHGALDAL